MYIYISHCGGWVGKPTAKWMNGVRNKAITLWEREHGERNQ